MPDLKPLKSPFPWFGGKSRAAKMIWQHFGNVPNFVDPFCGSVAVPLARPHDPGVETVNDANGWLCNFWRAVQDDPDAVAKYADWPVSELDLHARGDWLFYRKGAAEWVERLRSDLEFYDAKSAGWWVWGASCWIGGGWGPRSESKTVSRRMPHMSGSQGVNRQMPHVGDAGRGVHRQEIQETPTGEALQNYIRQLSIRIRRMRVLCGEWDRVLSPSITYRFGVTGVLLDPPYGEGKIEYAAGGNANNSIAAKVGAWAIANGENPKLKIALCGYEGQHQMPSNWTVAEWKAGGGYGASSGGESQAKENKYRERIWFSPACRNEASKGFLIQPVYRNAPRR